MRLKIVQIGEAALRQRARPLTADEIRLPSTQLLIEMMRETMRDAPGVGLAAPQVGLSLQLAVIEDRLEYMRDIPPAHLAERERVPVPFHVIINPRITATSDDQVEHFEGCLSVAGFVAAVSRHVAVRVEYLNERAEPAVIDARGWYARILQHEIDHLNGTIYIDRMDPRTFMTLENYGRYWKDRSVQAVRETPLVAPNQEALSGPSMPP
jgi:peptide deformylase